MIDTLHIEGFQSLQHVDIELGRFTVLVGPSNSGKSAIRRSLEALAHNDPPAGRLREGCPAYVVGITLDGTRVAIHKTTKSTTYQAGELLIDKPGATCPEAVSNLLRLSDTNFASQFDLPYLLAETPSAVARSLGELTNINVLFEGIREATRRQREAGKRGKVFVEQIDVLADKLAVYEDLPAEQDQLQRIHGALIVAADATNAADRLVSASWAATQALTTSAETSVALAQQPDWDYLEGTAAAIETTLGEAAMMDSVCIRAGDLIRQRVLADAELYDTAVPEIDFERIETLLAEHRWFEVAHQRAVSLVTDAVRAGSALVSTEEEIQAAAELADETICPLCELPLVRS